MATATRPCLEVTDDNKKEERKSSQVEHHGQIEKSMDIMTDREEELKRREFKLSWKEETPGILNITFLKCTNVQIESGNDGVQQMLLMMNDFNKTLEGLYEKMTGLEKKIECLDENVEGVKNTTSTTLKYVNALQKESTNLSEK